jgi:prephenate dehydrogenase
MTIGIIGIGNIGGTIARKLKAAGQETRCLMCTPTRLRMSVSRFITQPHWQAAAIAQGDDTELVS